MCTLDFSLKSVYIIKSSLHSNTFSGHYSTGLQPYFYLEKLNSCHLDYSWSLNDLMPCFLSSNYYRVFLSFSFMLICKIDSLWNCMNSYLGSWLHIFSSNADELFLVHFGESGYQHSLSKLAAITLVMLLPQSYVFETFRNGAIGFEALKICSQKLCGLEETNKLCVQTDLISSPGIATNQLYVTLVSCSTCQESQVPQHGDSKTHFVRLMRKPT